VTLPEVLLLILAIAVFGAALFVLGVVFGRWLERQLVDTTPFEPPQREACVRVDLHVFGNRVQTDMLVDVPRLELLAHALGKQLVDASSTRRH
jgi:hypothetical protein